MILFDGEHTANVWIDPAEKGCVRLAVEDFLSDLHAVSGRRGKIIHSWESGKNKVAVGTVASPALRKMLNRDGVDVSDIEGKWEHFLLETRGDTLYLVGSDERGAMWAVYECSRRLLGIDPMYLFTDHAPLKQERIEVSCLRVMDGPESCRFRGWFINDEDMIMGYCRKGKPEKDYDFHKDYAPMLSMIVETALRMKQNLLIPASHIDMDDPAQETLVKLVTDRGIFISQHHQEPVGVNQQRLDCWFKNQGDATENINYADHPEKYRQIWRHFIRKWAQYPNVIWQLGLRGRGDRPVWYQNSRIPDTTEARGALISAAILDQWKIIAEETGRDDFLCSSTLWMEGMPLYQADALRFPPHTMVILSDFGPDQMFGKEYSETPRRSQTAYGIYYHVCFWGCGPHLVQGNRPEKILFNYANAQQMGDTAYSILNVSNIREHLLGVSTVAKAAWHPDGLTARKAIEEWCEETLDLPRGEAAAALYTAYFDAFSHLDDTGLPGRMLLMDGMCKRVAMMLMRIMAGDEMQKIDIQNKRLFDFPSTDAFISYYLEATEAGACRFDEALKQAKAYLSHIPEERRRFFQTNLILQIQTILGLYKWVNALCRAARCRRLGESEETYRESVRQGVLALQNISSERKRMISEKWQHWWDGDTLIDVEAMAEKTAIFLHSELPAEKTEVL